MLDPVRGPEFQREPSLTEGARVQAKALPEAGSAPTWFARFSNGSGTIGRVERCAKRGGDSVPGMGYTRLNHDDPSIESFRGAFYKMRKALGATAFGINEIRLPPNTAGVEHNEQDTGHEEVYVVLEGSGTFTIDGDDVEVSPGDYVRVDADSTRVIVGGDAGVTFLAVGAKPNAEYDGRASL